MNFAQDQTVIVTGAGSGIGREIALLCNELGANVIAVGRTSEKLAEAGKQCANPAFWHSEKVDLLENIFDLSSWLGGLRDKYGKFYALAHAAGESCLDSLQSFTPENALHQYKINALLPFCIARAFSDRRICEKHGNMLFIASLAAVSPEKGRLSYGAAKAALVAGVRMMARELAGRLRVNCISPGIIKTPMTETEDALLGGSYLSCQENSYPLGLGLPKDVAPLAVFLLSSDARWITGQNYILDGGAPHG